MYSINITRTKASKINEVDFKNLGFGTVFSDHMLVCDYKDGHWSAPEVIPYQAISLMPSSKIFQIYCKFDSTINVSLIDAFKYTPY